MDPVRRGLLEKGLVYAAEDYGHIDFTAPRFDEFMRRRLAPKYPPQRAPDSRGR